MPIASASILVAIAIVNTTFSLVGLNSWQHSSSLKDSKIILPPRMVYAFYQVTETLGEHPADERHESLKKSEGESHDQHRSPLGMF